MDINLADPTTMGAIGTACAAVGGGVAAVIGKVMAGRKESRKDSLLEWQELAAKQREWNEAHEAKAALRQQQIDELNGKFTVVNERLDDCQEQHKAAAAAHHRCEERSDKLEADNADLRRQLGAVGWSVAEVKTAVAELKQNGNGGPAA